MSNRYFFWGNKRLFDEIKKTLHGVDETLMLFMNESLFSHPGEVDEQKLLSINTEDNCVYLDDVSSIESKIVCSCQNNHKILFLEDFIYNVLGNEKAVIRPHKLSLDASTACQLDCVDCYMRTKNYDGVGCGALSFHDAKKIIESYPYVDEVELSNNGEAFLAPDIIPILEFMYSKGIAVTFYNGVNLNTLSDELIEAIVRYNVKGITVSLDGASNEVYSKYRRNGDFNRVINNINKINRIKERNKVNCPQLIWQFILMEHNEQDIRLAKTMARELNMKIIFKIPWGSYTPVSPDYVKKETGLPELTRSSTYPWANRCRQLVFQPHINWDGRLLGCCSSHSMDFGINVVANGVESAINSIKYRSCIRDVFARKSLLDKSTPCGNCGIYYNYILDGEN